ncbi:MAG: hypothetical protein KIIPBIDF_01115 [Candidatus Methanoperedenaceae archaeon GB50]|nr:MAG: hypothetical protein KIIPBIDF_01115 [Candidatus Methanoperedenaceae archaeon GB50]
MSINLVLSTCPVGYKNPYLEKLPDTKKGKLLKTVITLKEKAVKSKALKVKC